MNAYRGSRRERGATLVEFAMVAPLFLMMMVGLFEFSRYVAIDISVSNASREGARFGAAIGENPDSAIPRYLDCAGIINAAIVGAPFADLTAADISITWDRGPGTAVYADCQVQTPNIPPDPTADLVASGDRIIVTVTKSYDRVAIPFFNLAGSSVSTATETRSIFKGEIGG